ncbi:MAG: hypothetical protein JW942_06435 [Opitutales bacterium]|nr:hypothetical protein [Opitutales bacterium]
MNRNILKDISHSSYVRLSAYVGMAWGTALGTLVFLASIISDGFNEMLPEELVAGMSTGLSCLLFAPPVMGLLGIALGWISYLAFDFLVKASDGLKIKSVVENCDVKPTPVYSTTYRRR